MAYNYDGQSTMGAFASAEWNPHIESLDQISWETITLALHGADC